MEGLQTSQLQQQQMQNEFRTELEENNKRMEGLVAEMKQEFNAFIRAMISKERAIPEEDRPRVEQAPLLPTPLLNQRLQMGSEISRAARKETSKILIPNPPRIHLPMFIGENSREWIRKCNTYCLNYQIPEDQKVEVIEIFSTYQEFNKLRQSSKVEEYQEKFEELKTLMMIRNQHLDEEYFVSSFISGLKDEIKTMIMMLKPATLSEAFDLAALQEEALRLQTRTFKEGGKMVPEDRFGISRSPSQHQTHNSHYRVLSTSTFRNTSFKGKTMSTSGSEPMRISAQEVQHRRNNGLCFKCGEKFGQGHQCKSGHLNLLVTDEEEESEFEDALGEQDESTGNPGHIIEMSLHALSEAMKRKTITLIGKWDGEEMLILVDTGSLDSYISNEACVTSKAICPKVSWEMSQHKFCFDLKVMDLSSWDMILGVDWMTHFSPITFDFHQLTIFLHNQGEVVQLRGQAENCDLDLIRGNDLRNFIDYKKQMCLALRMGQSKLSEEFVMPTEVQHIIEEFSDKGEIEKQVKDMMRHRIISHSNSPFASLVLLVKKKEGILRFCVDYKRLNEMTIKDRYPIPNIDELINELTGSRYKTKLDLTSGYHQIRIKPKDTHKTTFQIHCGHYEFLVMPFRLTNAPATFQSLMNQIFQPYLRKFVLVFFDDILIYSSTLELNLEHLKIVLSVLRKHKLFTKRSKCSFAQQKVDYLGHTITENEVSMGQSKIESIMNWPTPRTIKDLRGFLGLTGYYRRFIKHYGIIYKPLTELLKKDNFVWNGRAKKALKSLKHIMCKALVLRLPDFQKTFTIETDASGGGIGAVLM
ncbi:uncharacterized protein [Coffea arabica]|uniref:Reverse transcriptase domain-containing protein n=1 Tax=Coffea arabica TaxID=13443 RepID=A0ABM4X7J7_COFAR